MDVVVIIAVIAALFLFVYDAVKKSKELEGDETVFVDYADIKTSCPRCITQNIYRNRDGKRAKVGVLVSCIKHGKVKIGYSLCNKVDEYNEKEAYVLAGQRMADATLTPPSSIKKDVILFLDRCDRYYKNGDVPTFDGTTITNWTN